MRRWEIAVRVGDLDLETALTAEIVAQEVGWFQWEGFRMNLEPSGIEYA